MFLDPRTIVAQFGLTAGMSVADFGVGAGHFAFAMANKVGAEGKVYAFDVREEMLEVVQGYKKVYNITQVIPMRCNVEQPNGSGLDDKCLDMVLCSSILHQAQHPDGVLKEAHRVLKQGGKTIIIEWEAGGSLKPAKLFHKQQAQELLQACGFSGYNALENAGNHHYGIVSTKT